MYHYCFLLGVGINANNFEIFTSISSIHLEALHECEFTASQLYSQTMCTSLQTSRVFNQKSCVSLKRLEYTIGIKE
jgi:hypothetical protein